VWLWHWALWRPYFVRHHAWSYCGGGNLGLASNLGLVILVGILSLAVRLWRECLWANRFANIEPDGEGADELKTQN